jgi:hypothetical protein
VADLERRLLIERQRRRSATGRSDADDDDDDDEFDDDALLDSADLRRELSMCRQQVRHAKCICVCARNVDS